MITYTEIVKAFVPSARTAEFMRQNSIAVTALDWAKLEKVGLVHIFDADNPLGGLTIAFRKSTPYSSGVMVECAVATCSELDRFNRKVGATLAIEAFKRGETIHLPLLRTFPVEDINWVVKRAFGVMSQAI